MTKIDEYDYHLPEGLIAQSPVEPRDHARLMLVNKETGALTHKRFDDLIDLLCDQDVLVMNDTKVFKARVHGSIVGRNIPVEVVFLKPISGNEQRSYWEILVRKMRRLNTGSQIQIGDVLLTVQEKDVQAGVVTVEIEASVHDVIHFANTVGEVPLPPYIDHNLDSLEEYQTVYANEDGSVAAPTAGLHMTEQLLTSLKNKGVQIEYVTLHVGLGTFQPVWEDQELEDHKMHEEFVEILPEVATRIKQAKQEGKRIIALGTTTTRALEGAAEKQGELPEEGYSGDVGIFIQPGYTFHVVDELITNFHLPRTTLLLLVSALASKEIIASAYRQAVQEQYRFYSFGDAMFVCLGDRIERVAIT